MNQYFVRIDGQEAPESYSYEELRDMGVLDFDDIQIRKKFDDTWYNAKYYQFPETGSSGVTVDEYGQITTKKKESSKGITVDEYGQIVGAVVENEPSTPRVTTPAHSDHRSSVDWGGVWDVTKIILRFVATTAAVIFLMQAC